MSWVNCQCLETTRNFKGKVHKCIAKGHSKTNDKLCKSCKLLYNEKAIAMNIHYARQSEQRRLQEERNKPVEYHKSTQVITSMNGPYIMSVEDGPIPDHAQGGSLVKACVTGAGISAKGFYNSYFNAIPEVQEVMNLLSFDEVSTFTREQCEFLFDKQVKEVHRYEP